MVCPGFQSLQYSLIPGLPIQVLLPKPILCLVSSYIYGILSIMISAYYLILASHWYFQHLTEYCLWALNHTTKICYAWWISLLAYNWNNFMLYPNKIQPQLKTLCPHFYQLSHIFLNGSTAQIILQLKNIPQIFTTCPSLAPPIFSSWQLKLDHLL